MQPLRISFVRYWICFTLILLPGCNLPAQQVAPSSPLLPAATSYPSPVPPVLFASPTLAALPPGAASTPVPPSFNAFNRILAYGGGGAGGCYDNDPGYRPAFAMGPGFQGLWICIWAVSDGRPLRFDFIAPDGTVVQPIVFQVDPNTQTLRWDGYQEAVPAAIEGEDMEMSAWRPNHFPAGDWQVRASGWIQAEGIFTVPEDSDANPAIMAVNPGPGDEFSPESDPSMDEHLLKLKENGRLDMTGIKFPANIPAYVLLYQKTSGSEYALLQTQTVQTDSSGSVYAELAPALTVGASYLLVMVTDPNTRIIFEDETQGRVFDYGLPHDYFKVAAP
jgi:hypothetical protein